MTWFGKSFWMSGVHSVFMTLACIAWRRKCFTSRAGQIVAMHWNCFRSQDDDLIGEVRVCS